MAKLSPTAVVTSGAMKMPIVGLGTWLASDEEIEKAVDLALAAGYRHIDTAYVYGNEKGIGKALNKWLSSGKIKREDLFVVTKLPASHNAAELVEEAITEQLQSLGLDYVDLYLIHLPMKFKQDPKDPLPKDENGELIREPCDHVSLWKGMEAQVDAGRTKSIGLSNFNSQQIQRILDNARIKPTNLQVEAHLYLQQKELFKFCAERGITLCAYAPLGSPGKTDFLKVICNDESKLVLLSPLEDPKVLDIAKARGTSPSKILLRFLVESGFAVIPKSSNPQRIKDNIEIFDFELSEQDMKTLQSLDKGAAGRGFTFTFFPGVDKDPNFPFSIPY